MLKLNAFLRDRILGFFFLLKRNKTESSHRLRNKPVKTTKDIFVIYWPSTKPLIKRCIWVNKTKKSGSRWTLENNIYRCPGGSNSVVTGMPVWEPACRLRALRPSVTHCSAAKKCCYGREKNLGQYSRLSVSLLISHTQQNITLSKIKYERFIFL